MPAYMSREQEKALHSLPDGQPSRIETPQGSSLIAVVVHGKLHVYLNSCPHRGTELDWNPGAFLAPDGVHLQCATHGARFDPATGLCLSGPCAGEHLQRVEISA